MAPELLRFFVRCLLWSLSGLPALWAVGLLSYLIPSDIVRFFCSLLGYALFYFFFFGTGLSIGMLVLYGFASVLLKLLDKLPGSSDHHLALDASLIGPALARYQAKHPATEPRGPVQFSLAGFEAARHGSLPRAAHEQASWWTETSVHSQQWRAAGWQVSAVDLTGQEPTVTFTPILPAPMA